MRDVGFRFGAFELHRETGRLFKHGARIRLQTKPLQILEALLNKPGELVTREELFRTLWPAGTFVDFESGLNTATNRLRRALGDSAESPRYIETAPRLGYRFICPISAIRTPAPAERALPVLAKRNARLSLAVSVVAILVVFAWIHLNAGAPQSRLSFRQLTFRPGVVGSARFIPGSDHAVYTLTGEGEPPHTQTVALNGDGSGNFDFENGMLASVSTRGEIALISRTPGRLILLSQHKAAVEVLSEGARDADWLPDGSALALVRRRGVESLIEFPAGHIVYTSSGWIDSLRVSPSGECAAFFEHPVRDDDGGFLRIVDRQGHATTLTRQWSSAVGLAWSHSGKEIWFSASQEGFMRAIYAVSRTGSLRKVSNSPFSLRLLDVARDGRALVALDDVRVHMTAQLAGDKTARDASNLDSSHVDYVTRDGRLILFTEASSAVGAHYAAYTLDRESRRPVRFASGRGLALSPDGRLALTIDPEDRSALTLTSLASATSRKIAGSGFIYQWAKFLPGGNTLLVGGAYPLEPLTLCEQFLNGGTPVAIPQAPYMDYVEVSPDGLRFAGIAANQLQVFNRRSGKSQAIPAGERAFPVAWSADGEDLYAATAGVKPDRILKVHLRSGRRETWKIIGAPGARLTSVVAAPDAGALAYSAEWNLSRLYVVAGWS